MTAIEPARVATAASLARRIGATLFALGLLVLLAAAWRLSAGFPWIRASIVGLVALATVRPRDALLVLAGLSLPASVLGAAWQAPYSLRELLLLATLTGWSVRLAAVRVTGPLLPPDLSAPVICLTIVMLTSWSVELWGQRELLGPAEFRATIGRSVAQGLLLDRLRVRGLNGAIAHLEGIVLFAAAIAASMRHPRFPARIAAMAAVAAAGAGLLNIMRIVNAAVASPAFFVRLRELAATLRVNVHFTDVNAAGSYFAMMFFPAAAYAIDRRGIRRLAWLLCAVIIFTAGWLTKSRASLLAILVVAAGALVRGQMRSRARLSPRLLGTVAVCAAAALVLVGTFPNRVFGSALSTALEIRLVLVGISLQMFAHQPVFGVGVDGYYEASSPLLLASSIGKYYQRENAHNNYLQLLAEFGLIGFAVLLWLLWRVAARIRAAGHVPDSVVAQGVVAGMLAFALTALIGHPLLTPEVNQAFWLMLGAAVALYPSPTAHTGRRTGLAVAAFAVLMMTALPVRFRSEVATLNLEHVRYGVSGWITAPDGARYQTFTDRATLFASGAVSSVRIPVREDAASLESRLQIYLEGRLVNEVQTAREWRYVRILTPAVSARKNFLRIDLVPIPTAAVGRTLQVGRTEVTVTPDQH